MPFSGENAESYYDEGLTAAMKGDVVHAAQCFTKAIELDPGLLSAYHQLGRCHLRAAQAPGHLERAGEILQAVVKKKPEHVPARLDLGMAMLRLGNNAEARKQFMQVLAAQPANARAHLGLAQICFHEGNWDNAVTLAHAACAQSGARFSALFLLGRAAKMAGNAVLTQESLKEADDLITRSVELGPSGPEGYYLRGEVAFVQDHFAQALEHYGAALDRCDPHKYYTAFGESFTRLDILVKSGLCCQHLENVKGAHEIAEQILALDANHKLGQILREL